MTAREMIGSVDFESIESLENIIKKASTEYYGGESTITDEEFDRLVSCLEELDSRNPLIDSAGHGYSYNSNNKVEHKYGLYIGSMQKMQSTTAVEEVYKNRESSERSVVITPKYDGLSVVLYYNNGILERAVTRGDGRVGKDITDKVINIDPRVKNIAYKDQVAIRGEIYVSVSDWTRVLKKYPDAKNNRNFASGVINRSEITDDIGYLSIVLYSVCYIEGYLMRTIFDKVSEILFIKNNMVQCGSSVVTDYVRVPDIIEANKLEYYKELYSRFMIKYPVDGIVITSEEICNTDSKVEEFNLAYKFEPESKLSRVERIEWNSTRTGRLVPVVVIDTVQLSGTNVSRVTGFNAKFIRDNNIGIGSVIRVAKSNEIIPDIREVVQQTVADIPTKCHLCGGDITWDGVDIRCSNGSECSGATARDLQTFICTIGRTDNIGWAIIKKILDEINVGTIDELLDRGYIEIDENGRKHRELFNTVLRKIFIEPIELVDALCSLNIPKLGRVSALKIESNIDSLESLISEYKDTGNITNRERFYSIFGRSLTDSIFCNIDKIMILERLRDRLITSEKPSCENGTKVCITGKLSVKRSEFENELKKFGFVPTGISKDTKYLITDDPYSGSSKNKKAIELGIERISETEFRSKFMKG